MCKQGGNEEAKVVEAKGVSVPTRICPFRRAPRIALQYYGTVRYNIIEQRHLSSQSSVGFLRGATMAPVPAIEKWVFKVRFKSAYRDAALLAGSS